jgi:hypothetical protein
MSDPDLERERERQRVINAYHRVFNSEDGRKVLANLRAYFRVDRPAFERSPMQRYDALAAALRDGQREVMLFIEHKLTLPTKGDADVEKPKTQVTR